MQNEQFDESWPLNVYGNNISMMATKSQFYYCYYCVKTQRKYSQSFLPTSFMHDLHTWYFKASKHCWWATSEVKVYTQEGVLLTALQEYLALMVLINFWGYSKSSSNIILSKKFLLSSSTNWQKKYLNTT